jgi:hypothetical protein
MLDVDGARVGTCVACNEAVVTGLEQSMASGMHPPGSPSQEKRLCRLQGGVVSLCPGSESNSLCYHA